MVSSLVHTALVRTAKNANSRMMSQEREQSKIETQTRVEIQASSPTSGRNPPEPVNCPTVPTISAAAPCREMFFLPIHSSVATVPATFRRTNARELSRPRRPSHLRKPINRKRRKPNWVTQNSGTSATKASLGSLKTSNQCSRPYDRYSDR